MDKEDVIHHTHMHVHARTEILVSSKEERNMSLQENGWK